MVQVKLEKREVNCKLVYYGAYDAGKSTSLRAVAARSPNCQQVTSLSSESEDACFDYLPVELGKIDGLQIKLHVYTVPPHAEVSETRRAVLRDVDGVVFVVDSSRAGLDAAVASLTQLEADLRLQGLDPREVPIVFQWNKRDLADALDPSTLRAALDPEQARVAFETVATEGQGVVQTLKRIACLVLEQVSKDYGLGQRLMETRKVARPRAKAETQVTRRPKRLTESARLRSLSAEAKLATSRAQGPGGHQVVGIKKRRGLARLLSFGRR